MKYFDCEYVRDVYPDILHDRVDETLKQRVHAHVAECEDCRAEIALIQAIHAEPRAVPVGLEPRIAHAARAPRLRWRVAPGAIAMAATLAAAVIGGSILLNVQRNEPTSLPAAAAVAPAAPGLGAVGVDAAMMTGKASLEDLSVEQLEKLLGEIQS